MHLGDDGLLSRVDCPVHRGDAVSYVEDIVQIGRFGIHKEPDLGWVNIDQAGEPFIYYLMMFPDHSDEIPISRASSSEILRSALMTSHATQSISCGL